MVTPNTFDSETQQPDCAKRHAGEKTGNLDLEKRVEEKTFKSKFYNRINRKDISRP
jgi:hypothetical protein